LSLGVFVGNFIIHAVRGKHLDGLIVGVIAAALVFSFYGVWHFLSEIFETV